MKEVKDITNLAKGLVDFAIFSAEENKMMIKKDIKKFGGSSHVILPNEYSDGKHEAIVLIKEKNTQTEKENPITTSKVAGKLKGKRFTGI
jgi:putative transposon-encoded protein